MIYRIDDDAGARAGAVVRHRAGPLRRRRSSCCATTACSSATATRSRVGRHRAAAAAAPARHRLAGQRRLPRRPARPADLPAGRVREDRDHRLPGQLPARHAPAAGHRRRGAFAGVTIPPLKHFGPLLVVWGAAMADALLHPGPRLVADVLRRLPGRRSTWPPTASRSSAVGLALFARRARGSSYHARPTITHRVDAWLHPFGALYDRSGGSYQIAQSVFAQADGGLFGRGFGAGAARRSADSPLLPAAQTDLIYSVIVNELGLIGACAVLLHLPAGRRARLQDRHAGARLVLQAAGHGPDRGLRAAGLRHRRRRHARHPAHRRDAALHLLRRLVDPGQLRAAGAAAADLRPRAPRGDRAAVNAPIAAPVRRRRACSSRCSSASPRAGRCSTPMRCATTRKNRRELLEEQQIRRGLIRAGDGTVLARSLKQRRRQLRAHLSARARLFSHAVGYSFVRQGRAGLERFYDDDLTGRDATSSARSSTACRGTEQTGDNLRHHARPGRTARRRCSSSAGRKGAVVALDPRTGAIKVMASVPGYDPNTVKDQRAVQRAQPRPGRPAAQPQHAGRLSAGLDVQGRDRDRGHRLGPLHARLARQRAQRQDDLRRSPQQRRRRVLRRHHAHGGADEVGQHGVRRDRREARQGDDEEVHGPPGLRRARRGRPAARRARGQRRARARALIPATNGAVDVGRMAIGQDKLTVTPLQMAMVAAAVANGGKLMKPAPRRPDRRPRRAHGRGASSPRRCRRSCRPTTAVAGRRDDGPGRQGGHRHRRRARGHRRGRQDRHRRGRPIGGPTSCGSSPSRPRRTRASPSPLPWNAGPGSAAPSPPRSPRPSCRSS